MAEPAPGRYADLFRERSFRPFLLAGAFQLAAPSGVLVILLFSVALAYPAPERATYGALALAFLGLSSTVPTLLTAVFSGAFADRYDRGVLMRGANLCALLATALLAVDLVLRPSGRIGFFGPRGFYLPEWIVLAYPAWAAIASAATLFRPAYNTLVPRLVEQHALGRANGLIYAVAATASALTTVAVGALLTVAPSEYALAVPFLLFFATQVTVLLIGIDLSVDRGAPRRPIWAEAREGFSYLGHRRDLLEITISALVVNFLTALALVELALYVVSWLGLVQGIYYGAMVAAATLGTASGFLVIGHLRFEARAGQVMILLVFAMAGSLVALALVRTIWLALPILFVYGLAPGMITTVFLSTIQATVPDDKMGRVFAADELGSVSLVPAGQWAGGLLTLTVGVQGIYLFSGAAIALLGVVMLASFASLRRLGYHPTPPGEPGEPAAA
ncbi:MAG TPA: MFS transporter [Thermoplasmata archaeon]|nr:MFS transporter [Thermoplasmata archaeon]